MPSAPRPKPGTAPSRSSGSRRPTTSGARSIATRWRRSCRSSPTLFGPLGITKDDIDFICSGSTDYLVGGPFSFVSALDAIGVWPPRKESHVEMDGAFALYEAWVAAPRRRGRHRARLRVRQVVARADREDPLPPARPLRHGPVVAGPGLDRRPPGPLPLRPRQRDGGRLGGRGLAEPQGRAGQPQGPGRVRPLGRRALGRGVRRRPAAPPRPPPDHRRCGRRGARRRRPGLRVGRASRMDHRDRPPDRDPRCSVRETSPPLRPRPRRPRSPGSPTVPSTWPSCTPRSPPRRSSSPTPSGWDRRSAVNPSGGALAANAADGRRAHPNRRGRRRGSWTGPCHAAVAHATSGPCPPAEPRRRLGGVRWPSAVAVIGVGQTYHKAKRDDVSDRRARARGRGARAR